MMKMFCQNCGSILLPKKQGEKMVMMCSCGYVDKGKDAGKITEKVQEKPAHEKRHFETAGEEKVMAPTTEIECPKCHNPKAYYWTRQTRAGDEGETKFHQCTKCNHKWREYG